MSRRYQLKQRAVRQEETRQRIIETAIRLNGTLGLSETTVTQIAEEAGVGRQTVYRHFRHEIELTRACSGLYFQRHPLPDPEPWREIKAPHERTLVGLRDSYAYHRRTEAMISRVLPDAGESPIMKPYHDHWHRATEVIVSAWRPGDRKRRLLEAAIGHAIVFPTWHSLVRGRGLTDEEAIRLMLRLTRSADGSEA